ncbi:MAG: restriction endonuclease subunit S [Synergistaceae bacterium]|nr:restriction endonuclease subunit S [Synergistaceae bacterium]
MTGSAGLKRVSATYITNALVPVPPLSEQNEIAEYLDKKCAQIDKLITICEKQITELNELKARLISDAVTGKIDVR